MKKRIFCFCQLLCAAKHWRREDAGKGILLQIDNKGNLVAMGSGSAGVIVDGDVRDMIEVKTKN